MDDKKRGIPGFEATVIREFGKMGTAIRKSSEATNTRIDRLDSDLSSRITGLELRLERNDGLTRDSLKRLGNLESNFETHKRDNIDEISQLFDTESAEGAPEPEPRRGPFSISVEDLFGFLKILPLVVAIGAGVAGVLVQSCTSEGGKTTPPKVNDAPSGTTGEIHTSEPSPSRSGGTPGRYPTREATTLVGRLR